MIQSTSGWTALALTEANGGAGAKNMHKLVSNLVMAWDKTRKPVRLGPTCRFFVTFMHEGKMLICDIQGAYEAATPAAKLYFINKSEKKVGQLCQNYVNKDVILNESFLM